MFQTYYCCEKYCKSDSDLDRYKQFGWYPEYRRLIFDSTATNQLLNFEYDINNYFHFYQHHFEI